MISTLDKNAALVLIDLQKGVAALPLAHPVKDVLANTTKLVAAFRDTGLPIAIVNVNPAGAAWTKTRKDPNSTSPRPSQEDWLEIVPEIKTHADDIFITKHTWNAFYETALDDQLKKRGVTGIVLAGISTSIGVEGTARAASERGYNITFALDAMSDMFLDAHEHSIKRIFPRIGETGMTEDVVKLVASI